MSETNNLLALNDALQQYLHPSTKALQDRIRQYTDDPKGHIASIAQNLTAIFPPHNMRTLYSASLVLALRSSDYIEPEDIVPILREKASDPLLKEKKWLTDAYTFAADTLQADISEE